MPKKDTCGWNYLIWVLIALLKSNILQPWVSMYWLFIRHGQESRLLIYEQWVLDNFRLNRYLNVEAEPIVESRKHLWNFYAFVCVLFLGLIVHKLYNSVFKYEATRKPSHFFFNFFIILFFPNSIVMHRITRSEEFTYH